jgi:ubiquinone/menaquinone biosynthesis C-methylase UbiE
VISEDLLARVACPVCLEEAGCPSCAAPGGGHGACADYARRARCGCGGPDKRPLSREETGLRCPCCGALYALHAEAGYVDLAPAGPLGEGTHYESHEFQERLTVTDAPPMLSARIKADMMRRMLALGRDDHVLDLGCGAGKLALFARGGAAGAAGVDVAPFFLARAAREVDLVRGDLRRLPFRKGAYPRAYTLDVLEHLDEGGVSDVLVEARRVVGPQGRLFVYTHAMESSALARFQRAVNRLARALGERGLIDHEREAMRKSDHRNAIRSHEHFDSLCAEAGLRVAERRYYNVVAKAVVEDLLLRLVEQARRRGRKDPGPHAHGAGEEAPPAGTRVGAPAPGRMAMAAARALTLLLRLDVALFGRVRTGPFFGLLVPRGAEPR